MVVPEEEEWSFAYILLKLHPDDPMQLITPPLPCKWDGVTARPTSVQPQKWPTM